MNNPFSFEIEESPEFEFNPGEAGFGGPETMGAAVREVSEEELQYSIVISPTSPGDSRVRVAATGQKFSSKAFPFNAVCLIEIWQGGKFVPWASGSLISPQVVLTARHVLLKNNGSKEDKVRVTPGADFSAASGSNRMPAAPNHIEAPSRCIETHATLDYGVIVLPKKFSSPASHFRLQGSVALKQGDPLNVSGYPGDKPKGTQWFHGEPVVPSAASASHVKYTMDTCPGHSGSPVWMKFTDGKRVQVAVHTSGTGGCPAPTKSPNTGVRITCDLIKQVQAWCKKHNVAAPPILGAC